MPWLDEAAMRAEVDLLADEPERVRRAYDRTFATSVLPREAFDGDSVIADIGCGTEAFAVNLLLSEEPFEKLWMVDIDASSIDFARHVLDTLALPGHERVDYLVNTPSDLGLPPASIDLAVLINTAIGYAPQQGDDRGIITTLAAAIRDDGMVIYIEDHEHTLESTTAISRLTEAGLIIVDCGFEIPDTKQLGPGTTGIDSTDSYGHYSLCLRKG